VAGVDECTVIISKRGVAASTGADDERILTCPRPRDPAGATVSENETSRVRHGAGIDRTAEWDELRRLHLRPADTRPESSARGVHHLALLSSDVEATIGFYQGLLEFPLTKLFENRDYQGSTHFFFDIGNGNALAFFDMPGLDLGPYTEVLGGLHHLAISVEPDRWNRLKARLDAEGVAYAHIDEVSIYFPGPDGERIELIADRLGEMYGMIVL
jgi:catechol 2,3-dioxygenase-like lactoylglutathione lyase family enzyme